MKECRMFAITVIGVSGFLIGASEAQEPQRAYLEQVPPSLESIYQTSAADIDRLRETALDATRPAEERGAAYTQLSVVFPYATTDVAVSLSQEKISELALMATQTLVGNVVMMNHGGVSPLEHHSGNDRVAVSFKALQSLALNDNPAVRRRAAGVLATLGDRETLDRIESARKEGQISDLEALEYVTLPGAPIGAEYASRILEDGNSDEAAKSGSISYLGTLSDRQEVIRTNYLENQGASVELRKAAADVLAKSDPKFLSYGLRLAEEAGVPDVVVRTIIDGAIEITARSGDPTQINVIEATVEKLQGGRPNLDLQDFEIRMDIIQNRL